jgi:hypothetical protein
LGVSGISLDESLETLLYVEEESVEVVTVTGKDPEMKNDSDLTESGDILELDDIDISFEEDLLEANNLLSKEYEKSDFSYSKDKEPLSKEEIEKLIKGVYGD